MNPQEYRIKHLLDKYGETKIAPYECLPQESRTEINRKYYKNNIQKNRVQQILNETNTTKQVETEVHELIQRIDQLKRLCTRCKEEQIISTIILFIIRTHNNNFTEERTRIWKKYNLNWKLYSRIIANLLKEIRQKQPIK